MTDTPLRPGQVLTRLAETLRRLEALTAELTPAQARTAPGPGEWSANDVLAHLRACADVWGDSIARILAADRPTFRAVNPRAWIERAGYLDLDFHLALRAALLAVLESLPPAGWSRTATVTGAGRPLERTVLNYAERLARHERSHVRQIERLV